MRRAQLHRGVAEALERLRGSAPPLADLAHHYSEGVAAGTVDQAISSAVRLAADAAARFAFELAESQLDRARSLLASKPPSAERSERELDVQIQLSSVLSVRHGQAAPDVGRALARAGALSREVGDSARLLGSLRGAFIFACIGGHLDKAEQIGRQLLDLGHEGGQPAFLAAGHRAAGTVAFSRGHLADARRDLEASIALADTLDGGSLANVLNNPAVGARNMLALALFLLGDTQASDGVAEEALALARDAGVVSLVDTLFLAGIRRAMAGDCHAVVQCADEALPLAGRHGLALYEAAIHVLLGWAHASQRRLPSAVAEMEAALVAVRATGARMCSPFFFGLLADARMRVDRNDDALAAAEQGLEEITAHGERFWEPELHRAKGVLLATSAVAHAPAEAALLRAVDVARAQQSHVLEARAGASLSQFRGRPAERCG